MLSRKAQREMLYRARFAMKIFQLFNSPYFRLLSWATQPRNSSNLSSSKLCRTEVVISQPALCIWVQRGQLLFNTARRKKKVSDAHFLLRCTQLIFTFCSEGKTLKIFNHICGLAPGDGHKSVLIALCINAKRLTVRSPTVKEPLST